MHREVLERVVEALKKNAIEEGESTDKMVDKDVVNITISGDMHGDIINAPNLKIVVRL